MQCDQLLCMSEEANWSFEMFHEDVKALIKAIKALIALRKGDIKTAEEHINEAEGIIQEFERRLHSTPEDVLWEAAYEDDYNYTNEGEGGNQ